MVSVTSGRPASNDYGRSQCIEAYSRVLEDLGLVDASPDEDFDRFSSLVRCTLRVPVGLVTFVEEHRDRQYFKSQIGLSDFWARRRQTPLTHSFCQLVKRDDRPLVIPFAPDDERVCENLALPELGVRAYLGVPFHDWEGRAMGALAAIDTKQNNWLDEQVRIMQGLAACVTDQIKLRYTQYKLAGTLANAAD